MSIEKIQLPDFLVSELYKNSLVEIEDQKTKKEAVPKKNNEIPTSAIPADSEINSPIKYLGENRKNISILVNSSDAVILPDEELAFLTNILNACQLNLGDLAIVNMAKQTFGFAELQQQLKAEKVLLFNVSPRVIDLPFNIPNFQIQPFNGCRYLLAPALSQINQENSDAKQLKRSLWECLKKMFEL